MSFYDALSRVVKALGFRMKLTPRARQILEVMAEDCEEEPQRQLRQGVPPQVFSQKTDVYLHSHLPEIDELKSEGFVNEVKLFDVQSHFVITEKGYRYMRSPYYRFVRWLSERKAIASIVGASIVIIGVLAGVVSSLG
ncbi:MAG: hypothetical protein ACOC6S_00980 [Chloroflexota bacterium]